LIKEESTILIGDIQLSRKIFKTRREEYIRWLDKDKATVKELHKRFLKRVKCN